MLLGNNFKAPMLSILFLRLQKSSQKQLSILIFKGLYRVYYNAGIFRKGLCPICILYIRVFIEFYHFLIDFLHKYTKQRDFLD